MGAAAAVILMKERRVIEAFVAAGATTPAGARTLDELGVHEGFPLARLRDRAVVRPAAPDRFFVDLEVWRAVRRTRRRLIAVIIAVVLMALAGSVFATLAH